MYFDTTVLSVLSNILVTIQGIENYDSISGKKDNSCKHTIKKCLVCIATFVDRVEENTFNWSIAMMKDC